MVYCFMRLSDIVIVLNRASEPGNVGAVCRAMKNAGLSRLRMAAPGVLNEETLLTRAIHAEDIWREACFFNSLEEAVADCSVIIGTTCRRGKKRKSSTMDPRSLTTWLNDRKSVPAAIVFGNERTGLTESELNLCNIASHIPVSDSFPSLNLSHAVQIYAYELFTAFGGTGPETGPPDSVKGEWVPLTRLAACELTESITGTLASLGFYKHRGREEQTRFLLDFICRAGLTEKEGRYLRDIFVKAARLGANNKEQLTVNSEQ